MDRPHERSGLRQAGFVLERHRDTDQQQQRGAFDPACEPKA